MRGEMKWIKRYFFTDFSSDGETQIIMPIGNEKEEKGWGKAEGGWVSVDKRTDLLGFPAFGCSGEEGWLEQDGKVCDKRNSSDFIVPLQYKTAKHHQRVV